MKLFIILLFVSLFIQSSLSDCCDLQSDYDYVDQNENIMTFNLCRGCNYKDINCNYQIQKDNYFDSKKIF